DGRTIFGVWGRAVRQWDAATGRPVGQVLRHLNQVDAMALSPDGRVFAVSGLQPNPPGKADGGRGGVRLFDVATLRPLGPTLWLDQHANARTAFSPDGKALLVSGGWETRLWDVPAPVKGSAEQVRLWVEVGTGLEMDGGGATHELDAKAWQRRRARLI